VFGPGIFQLDAPVYFCDSVTVSGTLNSLYQKLTTILVNSSFSGAGKETNNWHPDSGWNWDAAIDTNSGSGVFGTRDDAPPLKRLTIKNLIIQGDSATVDYCNDYHISGIRVGGSNITIRNCNINNMRYMGIYVNGDSNTITRCNIHNTGCDGINAGGVRNIILSENNISKTRDNAIGFDCMNIKSGGQFVFGGIRSLIANNIIDNSDQPGYDTSGVKCSHDGKNWYYYSSDGIYIGRGAHDSANGISFGVESLTVANNRIISSWLHGINIDHYCRNLTIANNQVLSPKLQNCIALEDYTNRITISGNYLHGSRGSHCSGIVVNPLCSLININNNFIDTCVENAIAINTNCNNININNNIIDSCKQNAVTIDSSCSRIGINGNRITRAPNGITVSQSSDSIVMLGNTIKKITNSPVYIYKGTNGKGVKNLTMSSNMIDESGGGVTIEKAQQFSFIGNTVANSPWAGLYIMDGSNFFISGNTFKYNGSSGSTYQKSGIAIIGPSYNSLIGNIYLTNNLFKNPCSSCRAITIDRVDTCGVSGNRSYGYGSNYGYFKCYIPNRMEQFNQDSSSYPPIDWNPQQP
jgi:parallel beta-helix repeat protein